MEKIGKGSQPVLAWSLDHLRLQDTLIKKCTCLVAMGGLGACPCCKQDRLLTEHHSSELGEKIMICRDCHDVIEEYFKLIEKYRKLSETPKEQTTPSLTAPTAENIPKL